MASVKTLKTNVENRKAGDMHCTDLADAVTTAWHLRLASKIPEAMESLANILQKLRCYSDLNVEDFLSEGVARAELPHRINLLVLHASLVRRSAGVLRAKKLLKDIQEQISKNKIRPTYYFHFEMGLIALTEERHWDALKQFTHAGELAVSDIEKACAEGNIIIAMEAQDLSWQARLDSFKDTLKSYSQAANELANRQILALEDRTAFRSNDFSFADVEDTSKGFDQRKFFILYTRQLRELYAQDERNEPSRYSDYMYEFQGNYRVQTLTNHVNLNASSLEIKAREVVNRLYLWVWRWLNQPEHAQMQRIVHTIKELADFPQLPHFMASDSMMLANALDWILLFGGQKRRGYVSTASLMPTEFSGLSLQLERCLIDLILAMRDDDKVLTSDRIAIAEHLLSQLPKGANNNSGVVPLLRRIITLAGQGKFKPATNLEQAIFSCVDKGRLPLKNRLNVDISSSRISYQTGSAIYCRAAAITLFLLRTNGVVSIYDILEYAFGHRNFDSALHDSKINNTIYRINKLIPEEMRLKRKRDAVYFDNYEIINTRSTSMHCFTVISAIDQINPLIFKISNPNIENPSEILSSEFVKRPRQVWYARKELEVLLGVSRSTVIRALQHWREKKLVEVKGVGKASRYRLEKQFEESLLSGEIDKTEIFS